MWRATSSFVAEPVQFTIDLGGKDDVFAESYTKYHAEEGLCNSKGLSSLQQAHFLRVKPARLGAVHNRAALLDFLVALSCEKPKTIDSRIFGVLVDHAIDD